MNNPPDHYTVLTAHVINTLPDSITQRRRVLEALFVTLAPKHPARASVRAALQALNQSFQHTDCAQLKFARILK